MDKKFTLPNRQNNTYRLKHTEKTLTMNVEFFLHIKKNY
jgi:hypothetical protein